jgi:hypothetical protein
MVLPDEKVRREYGQVPLLAVAESNMDDGCNNSHDIPIHPTSVASWLSSSASAVRPCNSTTAAPPLAFPSQRLELHAAASQHAALPVYDADASRSHPPSSSVTSIATPPPMHYGRSAHPATEPMRMTPRPKPHGAMAASP